MRIYLPKRRGVDGKSRAGHRYRVRFTVAGKVYDLPTGLTDKRAAEEKARAMVIEREREAVGLLPPQALREAGQVPLVDHLDSYLKDRRRRQLGEKYTETVELRLSKLLDECGWRYHRDITSRSFENWAVDQASTLSVKTVNEYLGAARAFLKWMRKHGLAEGNPLEIVGMGETRGREKLRRRALSVEECRALIDHAGPRAVLYLAAMTTGLRRNELESLRWSDINLDVSRPFIHARASTTKNRKDAFIPVCEELRLYLEAIKANGIEEGAPVFPRMYRLWHFRRDLKAARISEVDSSGRRIDFHALRKTFCTMLAVSGAAPRVAQELMRHSDPRLTSKVYTDTGHLPLADAIAKLPSVVPHSLFSSLRLFRAGHNGSASATAVDGHVGSEVLENKAVGPLLTQSDHAGQKVENGSGGRARTYNLVINSHPLYH